MKVTANIALEHGGRVELEELQRRCVRVSKHGCGQLLSLTKFKSTPRKRKDGTYRLEHNTRCIECDRVFHSAPERRRRGKADVTRYTEYTPGHYPAIRKYFSLKPVKMSQEIRRVRREGAGGV
jgi:hypothetical protein